MSYLAFALKYRPKSFDEVIGQDHVTVALKNAIIKDRVHHAYLFSGPRGIGKTSLARILAKSLNCKEGPTLNPCGKCLSCVEISKGRSLDIIEIDGASNRGIDEIRTLRENVKLSAASSRYKIYIVDEVHMLTQEAFNALLKTLEEPPAHVKFVFATTHPHKVLPTILSRCQKFQFNLIPLEKIVIKLKKIAKLEKINVQDNLVYTIARAAEGSIRDAESLFDQLAPVILEKGSLMDVFSFLGIIDEESLNNFLKLLLEKNLSACLDCIEAINSSGKDLGIFLNAFIEHLRNLLLAKVSIKNFEELSDISPESKDFIADLAKKVTVADVLSIIDLLIEVKDLSKSLNTVRIPLELALVKYTHGSKLNNPSSLSPKKHSSETEDKPLTSGDSGDFERSIDAAFPEDEEKPKAEEKAEEKNEEVNNTSNKDNILLQPIKAQWKSIISHIQKIRAALSSHLSFAQPIYSQGSRIVIGFSPQDSFHKEIVASTKNSMEIENIISKFISKKIGVKFVTSDTVLSPNLAQEPEPRTSEGNPKSTQRLGSDDEFLNELLDTFGGKFHTGDE